MNYALILTTYIFGAFQSSPIAVTQTSTPGFTSQIACTNAGKVAQAGVEPFIKDGKRIVVTYQCPPLNI